jgi:ATP-dependent protease ClpP protease subunit
LQCQAPNIRPEGPAEQQIHVLPIIGQIEGHQALGGTTKATQYEDLLPRLAAVEQARDIGGLLILLNTAGGDVEAGLAIAELIAGMSKPTAALVLGGSHSIGVPIAVAARRTFIAPTGTMVLHPVRITGTVLGVPQTAAYFRRVQGRIEAFVTAHSRISAERLRQLMQRTDELVDDIGSSLTGREAVEEGLCHQVGGLQDALRALYEMMEEMPHGS